MIKCITIDDEPLALAQLTVYISRVPFLQHIKACQDAFEALQLLSEEEVDLIFVDINMPDLNGMDFVRSLVMRPLIIFTTAYSEYAVEGFKVDAVDYLLKPFSFQDFLKAADKARKQLEYRSTWSGENEANIVNDGSLFVKSDYKVVRININEIKYVECMSEYVRIFTEGEEKPIMTLLSMRKLEERLPTNQFMRVHRSYIVNLQKIVEISRLRIIFDGNTYIPIGENYKEKFTEYINKMCLGK
ncbi:LytTR family DNA-binding domain-containing protein [uncultured Bacteroides sp.]|uniref:LytR/AlgR family response regulator transcription factor n=1 Tax=uncultured Bacteroides sp. TaxID=162156 RepID=UPI002AA89BEB|nr:LytTR family DNA-binding domain-containing protein [uncultured Bacteroides sp.]